jgi:hypothetical protein
MVITAKTIFSEMMWLRNVILWLLITWNCVERKKKLEVWFLHDRKGLV